MSLIFLNVDKRGHLPCNVSCDNPYRFGLEYFSSCLRPQVIWNGIWRLILQQLNEDPDPEMRGERLRSLSESVKPTNISSQNL